MKNVVALVLAGGRTGRYGVLTLNRAKGALTFGGHYRIVDFALSNLRRSGLEQIGLIIQYLPSSLIDHVGVGHPWDLHGYGRVCKIMPPFVGINETAWYRGTADALFQNLNLVRDLRADHVIVLSGEHVYNLDFAAVMAAHLDSAADLTMVLRDIPAAERLSSFGYAEVSDNFTVTRFHEKPNPVPDGAGVSAGIYVFRVPVLARLLAENAEGDSHNLAKDILEPFTGQLKTRAFWMDELWYYLPNALSYHATHASLCLGPGEGFHNWGILTNLEYRGVGSAPPPRIGPDASVSDVALSAGAVVEGTVERSVLSPGVTIAPGAIVRNSILMHDCRVEAGAVLDGVISDKDAVFGPHCRLGLDESALPPDPDTVADLGSLVLVGKNAVVGGRVTLPRTIQVAPGARLPDQGAVDSEILALAERTVPSGVSSPYLMRGRA